MASSNRYPIELVFEGVNRCVIRVATKPSKIKKDHIFQIGGKLEQETIEGDRIFGSFKVTNLLGQDHQHKKFYGGNLPKFEVVKI